MALASQKMAITSTANGVSEELCRLFPVTMSTDGGRTRPGLVADYKGYRLDI